MLRYAQIKKESICYRVMPIGLNEQESLNVPVDWYDLDVIALHYY